MSTCCRFAICLLSCLFWIQTVAAQDTTERAWSLGGLAFGDLYHVPSHHLPEGDGATGAVLRRGYLTFDIDFTTNWFARARLELNQDGEFESYDFELDFKDLYTGWNLGRHKLIAGLTGTPTFDLIESIWGARYLARTPMDMQGVASRDTGVYVKGPLNASGTLGYRVMAAAPVEFGAESNPNDRQMGALSWSPNPALSFDLYLDFEERSGPFDRTTWQAFAGYKTDTLRWGVQYSNQDREADPSLELASAFLVTASGENSNFIGRVDRIIEPSPKGNNISYIPFDPSAPATMLIGGWEYRFNPHFRITPNLVMINYDRNDEGVRPETDLHLRLTMFLDFE